MHFHAVIWIDHQDAHVIGFGAGENTRQHIRSNGPHHIHHKAGDVGSGHLHDAPAFFRAVADALSGFREILVVGPAETKQELVSFLNKNRPGLVPLILGVEAMGHASEGEIVDHARRFFAHADRATPQI